MKREERIVFDYLESSGYHQIEYEPDGQRPPDFSINNDVGIEVRRLSQQHLSVAGYRSLEEEGISFLRCVESVLSTFEGEHPTDSYWVVLTYKRPFGSPRAISRALRKTLVDFLIREQRLPREFVITPHFRISIYKANSRSRKKFRIGVRSDWDSGGWVVEMYTSAIRLCIQDKLTKIAPYFQDYSRWWLILVDMIISELEQETAAAVRQQIVKPTEFERIFLIDPIAKTMTFEL